MRITENQTDESTPAMDIVAQASQIASASKQQLEIVLQGAAMIGTKLGHYEVLEKLGEGGMGVVYKARDTHLDRSVAIKVLPAGKVSDPQRKARFVQEAKAASALNHPNIITIHDIASQEGCDFIVMEYVAGKTLDEIIPRKGMKLGDALKIAVQAADALARAHSAGIVHRDLKPSNTMVDEHGLVKILDFGLAKLTEQIASGEAASTATVDIGGKPITEEGAIVGTVSYMSPEQAEGKKVDARSDIFSFGSLLYEMVTGQQAFRGDSKISTLAAIINKEPAALPAETPHDLEKVISRCLRKDPARRFQNMADLKVALEELKEESDSGKLSGVTLAAPKPRRRAVWLAVSLGAIALGAVALYFLRPTERSAPSSMTAVPLTSYAGYEYSPSFSPDGNQIAFVWDGEKQDNLDICVKLIGPGSPIRITSDPAEDYDPAWSPDGRWIAFVRTLPDAKAGFFVIPALGGPERKLAETSSENWYDTLPGSHVAWSADSKWLIIANKPSPAEPSALFCLSVNTGEMRQLTHPPATAMDSGVALSPDGRTLAFVRTIAWGASDIYLLPLSGELVPQGEPVRLTFEEQWTTHPTWTPDGREIVFSLGTFRGTSNLWKIAVSGRDARPQRVASVGEDGRTPAISRGPSPRLAYARFQTDVNIWRRDLSVAGKGQPAAKFIASSRNDCTPRYSPDGKRIAFHSDRSGSIQLWVANEDGSNASQITSQPAFSIGWPAWSPDSQHILFTATVGGQWRVFQVGAMGGEPTPLSEHVSGWSRDGRWIYQSSQFQIWKRPAAGGELRQVTQKTGLFLCESPDGEFVYYCGSTSPPSLWRVPVDGGEETEVLHAIDHPSNCSITDQGIYFVPVRNPAGGGSSVIQLFHLATGKIEVVATLDKDLYYGLTVSPDGRWLLYSQVDQQSCDLMLVENFR
jgi:serine/threonine protein kinase